MVLSFKTNTLPLEKFEFLCLLYVFVSYVSDVYIFGVNYTNTFTCLNHVWSYIAKEKYIIMLNNIPMELSNNFEICNEAYKTAESSCSNTNNNVYTDLIAHMETRISSFPILTQIS